MRHHHPLGLTAINPTEQRSGDPQAEHKSGEAGDCEDADTIALWQAGERRVVPLDLEALLERLEIQE